jgi:hypothetical protein
MVCRLAVDRALISLRATVPSQGHAAQLVGDERSDTAQGHTSELSWPRAEQRDFMQLARWELDYATRATTNLESSLRVSPYVRSEESVTA